MQQYYVSTPKRPNPYLAVAKAMLPTRKTWKSDLVDYAKIIVGGAALWVLGVGVALIVP